MSLATLSCDTLGSLDGGIARHVIDREIRRAVEDYDNRASEDKKERVITIKITMTPHENLTLVSVEAYAKLPPMRTGNTDVRIKQTPQGFQGLFQTYCPENADQKTIQDVIDEGGADA